MSERGRRAQVSQKRSARPPSWLTTGALAVLSLICAVAALVTTELDSDRALDLGLISATTACLGLFWEGYRRHSNVAHPMCLSALQLFLLYPFHGWVTGGSLRQQLMLGDDPKAWLARACVVMVVSVPLLALGYWGPVAPAIVRLLPTSRRSIPEYAPLAVFVPAYLVGTAFRVVAVLSGVHFHHGVDEAAMTAASSFQFVTVTGASIPTLLAVYAHGVRLDRGPLSRVPIDYLLLAVEIGWGLLSGSRLKTLTPLVAFAVMRAFCGRPLRIRQGLIAGGLAVVVLFPFLTAYRAAYSTTERGGDAASLVSNVQESLLAASDAEASPASLGDGDSAFEPIAERFHGLSSLALVMRYTPERQEWLLGKPIALVPLNMFVPRAVWPSKPKVAEFADVFRQRFWGLDVWDSTAVAPSLLGDLWAQLHIVGVLVGSLLFGVFMSVFLVHARLGLVGSPTFSRAAAALMSVSFLHAFEGCFDGALAGHIKTIVVYALVGLLAARGLGQSKLASAMPQVSR